MSTVKIKTEPATTAAATAAVDVKVKLEPSFSTADIKLEQHTSDIDTKVEPDSEADSEEDEIKSESDDEDDNSDQNQFTIIPKNQRQLICNHPGCGRRFNYAANLRMHQHQHRLQTELSIHGKAYTLARQSLNDRWSCPIVSCSSTAKTVSGVCDHLRVRHGNMIQQPRQQQSPAMKTRKNIYFLDVDDFYVNGVRCGYHTTTGVFICYQCRLVPEYLLTHLQQNHGYDEKLIDSSALPDSAVNAGADPNINQHTSNSHLAAAIREPNQMQHRDILQGWVCVASGCGCCGHTIDGKSDHKRNIHQGDEFSTVPALVLRLVCDKRNSCYFLISRIDQVIPSSNTRVNWHKLDYSHSGLNTQDGNDDDTDHNETTDSSSQRRQWKCEYPNCGRSFNTSKILSAHQREHKLEVVTTVHDVTFTLSRQSSGDRWVCPVPDCDKTYKTIEITRVHIRDAHTTSMKQKRDYMEDDDGNQHQQPIIKKKQYAIHYLKVDNFYIGSIRCGYHTTTRVFICHECRVVPECLLTHLQQKHGFDVKSIDNSTLPDSAVNANADPNINQHTSNPHLTVAISQPYQWRVSDILQGWLCVTSDCGYCFSTKKAKDQHRRKEHKGEQLSTAPALVLRLLYAKIYTSCFLITRLDTAINNTAEPSNSASQDNNECNNDDDGDELVLSDYSD